MSDAPTPPLPPEIPNADPDAALDDEAAVQEEGHEILHVPEPGERQLTVRAVATGCVLGAIVASMNINFGLKTGWSIGGSLIAAILGFSFWTMLRAALSVQFLESILGASIASFLRRFIGGPKYTPLETNITQTAGSAAGSMASTAGLLAAIPALGMLGTHLAYHELVLWAFAVGYLGVFFAVPLRHQMVVVENLRFPTGTATAETIMSFFAVGSTALAQARALLIAGIVAGAFSLLVHYVPSFEHPEITYGAFAIAAAWGFSILISPLMYGAGLLIGPRVGTSLLLGAIVGWALLGPYVQQQGWAEGAIMSYADGPRGWILWPGVAIMVGDALTNLALSWRTILATFKPVKRAAPGEVVEEEGEERVPPSWWIGGLGAGTVLVTFVAWHVFEIPPYLTLIAVAMSSVLAAIAVRSTGETDINPIGGMGKVTQLVFGGIRPGDTTTNLMAAGITGAGASQAGDMMQDLKTGRMLGASPRRQIIAQCIGIAAGVPIATGIFKLFDKAYEMGGEQLPAPAAHAWRAMAELLAEGFDQLPTNVTYAIAAGFALGILVPVLRRTVKPIAPFLPSTLAFGIAFIVPAYYSVAMFLGSMVLLAWKKLSPKTAAVFVIAVASGFIAGDGLMGVVKAILTVFENAGS